MIRNSLIATLVLASFPIWATTYTMAAEAAAKK
jgi:hypothetical protein